MEIKEKYGIPCFSKEQDFYIYYYQNAIRKGKKPSKTIQEKINGTYRTGFCLSKKASKYVLSGNAHNCLRKKPVCFRYWVSEATKVVCEKDNTKIVLLKI